MGCWWVRLRTDPSQVRKHGGCVYGLCLRQEPKSACPDQICLRQVLLKCEEYGDSVYGLCLRQDPQERLP